MKSLILRTLSVLWVFSAGLPVARAWDYEGHRLINQLALASLPTNFPTFVFSDVAKERIAFLAGEPDRWRNTPDLSLRHVNNPDHYIDLDDLPAYAIEPASLSPFRYEFVSRLALARAATTNKLPTFDPENDPDRTKALVGFLPWTITEQYAKLKSAFSYLKALEKGGTLQEVENAQQNIVYLMGVMGHFVGDGSQPLHTTKHFNGWVGENPHRYATNRTFHGWIDGGYIQKAGLNAEMLVGELRPAELLLATKVPGLHTNVFPLVMMYLTEQFNLVEPLYQLEKKGKLSSRGEPSVEGREFFTKQLIKAGQMLGDLWLSAWQYAPPDTYLTAQLAKRKLAKEGGTGSTRSRAKGR